MVVLDFQEEIAFAEYFLQFKGFLSTCEQRFVRFDEQGRPVRAFLTCTFIERRDSDKQFVANPLNSPDTTKYHTVKQGDSLWSLAAEEWKFERKVDMVCPWGVGGGADGMPGRNETTKGKYDG